MELDQDILVKAPPDALYEVVSDARAMARFSPECRKVLGPRGGPAVGRSFIGLNRRGPFFWFTWCRVVHAEPAKQFTFDVSIFGLPVARWGYHLSPEEEGTRVTETWRDLRTGRGARLTEVLGLVFTGTPAHQRAARNRAGMRTTLFRLKRAVERQVGTPRVRYGS
ncbi:SRPBCC family protein [Streptomyces flavofungini]|uniref:SRPBCC family protein n=1 Tax=Streptomyces flavofungini TaxID=68200 RepID=UPI0034DE042A